MSLSYLDIIDYPGKLYPELLPINAWTVPACAGAGTLV